jgi:hypothetical protein
MSITSVTTELVAYGSCDQVFWEQFVADQQFGYHVTRADNLEAIMTSGLLPCELSGTDPSPECEPARGDCVYFGTRELWVGGWLHTWVDCEQIDSVVIGCDLSALDVARVLPDEDAWIEQMAGDDPGIIGLGRYEDSGFTNGGQWAQAVRLGAQAGSVELSIRERERFCVLGGVEPSALFVAAIRGINMTSPT